MELQVHPINLRMSNAYVVELPSALVLVDAGSPGDTQKILSRLNAFRGKPLRLIYITHAHLDHYGAAASIQRATNTPLAIHAEDAGTMAKGETHLGQVRGRGRLTAALMPIVSRLFPVEPVTADLVLQDGQDLGNFGLPGQVLHTPGHTPGQCCFDLGDDRIIVGDTVFVGGPGRTWSPQDFTLTMKTLQQIVFQWPDETMFFPGHGSSGKIGDERAAFEAFAARGWPRDLEGDITWKSG